ncbi:hypothetical protein [Halorubrum laminariae]|uniref:Uncharacterized protein n=1 Tax=Halorubrum laminariae TaxID=1433523 RepID=A0ABD6BYT6_9EURY|nr:hypothetical protein [Halorubrum laminariae]
MSTEDDQKKDRTDTLSEKSANTVLTNQIKLYQHIQRTATRLLNVTIGFVSVLITGVGVVTVYLPDRAWLEVSRFDRPFGAGDDLVALTILLSIVSGTVLLLTIAVALLTAYSNLAALLWPRDLSPIFQSDKEKIRIIKNTGKTDSLEDAINTNNYILNELRQTQSDSYRLFIFAFILSMAIFLGIISISGGNIFILVLIHYLSVLVPGLPVIAFVSVLIISYAHTHYVVYKICGMNKYVRSCYVSVEYILSNPIDFSNSTLKFLYMCVSSGIRAINLRNSPTPFFFTFMSFYLLISLFVCYVWYELILSQVTTAGSNMFEVVRAFL